MKMKNVKNMFKGDNNQENTSADSVVENATKVNESTGNASEVSGDAKTDVVEGDPLFDEIEKLKGELDEQKDTLLRVSAEFQNSKRRMEKEKADIYKFANEKLIIELLPVMDNFDRALTMMKVEDNANFTDGIDMIRKGLKDFFDKNNIKEIEADGADFDPNQHHAVMAEEVDGVEADKVITVLQKGYTLNDKVIRPAMVKVSS